MRTAALAACQQNSKALCINLLTSERLNSYLTDIDKQTMEMFFQLVKQMAECEGVTQKLKAENQMKGVAQTNNIRAE